jgi:catechol 1,2-dioxygenase
MAAQTRRDFFRFGGLAALGSTGLVLRGDAMPTPTLPDAHGFEKVLFLDESAAKLKDTAKPTEDNIVGPYFRAGAPYRAKITPPVEPGIVMVIQGRVWGFDTKKPLASAVLDIWQANAKGRYDNDDEQNPPAKDVFINRARLLTDENGYYEFETVHPGPYQTSPNTWRPSHIHYMVRHNGYARLITQLYFKGDKYNKTDEFIKDSLIIDLHNEKINGTTIERGTFDVVLAPVKM